MSVKINADIYCSGAPNYFIFAVSTSYDSKGDSYTLINNTHWVRTSNPIDISELSKYYSIGKDSIFVNN
ncbi:hypothetical protein RCIP0023_00478 [Klebsiella phage RCIP0023]